MKKLTIFVNYLENKKTGEKFTSYRTKNEKLDKFVNVIFCKDAKNKKPLNACVINVDDGFYSFTKDRNGYDVCFVSRVESFEPYIKEALENEQK